MIKFFRKIRYDLMEKNKTGRYLKYAIGEIVLVVIGILIALQINNWNEEKKLIKIEHQLLENLITSLKKDSTEIVKIIPYLSKSVKQHNQFINSSVEEIINTSSEVQISEMLFDLWLGVFSFFPRYGTYNSIVSSKGIDIIESKSIKSKLIDLYDYDYKRYESIDLVLDNSYQNSLLPFLNKEIGFHVNANVEHGIIDKNKFKNKYEALQLKCENLTSQLYPSLMQLQNIQKNVNALLKELQVEMNK